MLYDFSRQRYFAGILLFVAYQVTIPPGAKSKLVMSQIDTCHRKIDLFRA